MKNVFESTKVVALSRQTNIGVEIDAKLLTVRTFTQSKFMKHRKARNWDLSIRRTSVTT